MKRKLKITMFILLGLIFISSFVIALEPEMIYFLNIEYNKGELNLININLISGYSTLSKDSSLPYKLELFSVDEELLYQGYFEIPSILFGAPPLPEQEEKSGPIELENVNFSISLPYYKNGNLIKITKDEIELLKIDVSKFRQYCGDLKCLPDENFESCPQDCAKPKEISPIQEGSVTIPFEKEKKPIYVLVAIITIILLVVILIIYFKKRNKSLIKR